MKCLGMYSAGSSLSTATLHLIYPQYSCFASVALSYLPKTRIYIVNRSCDWNSALMEYNVVLPYMQYVIRSLYLLQVSHIHRFCNGSKVFVCKLGFLLTSHESFVTCFELCKTRDGSVTDLLVMFLYCWELSVNHVFYIFNATWWFGLQISCSRPPDQHVTNPVCLTDI